jgi:methionine sulfoxide reductase heme-binding subunit
MDLLHSALSTALHSHLLWYLNRATGVVLLALLTASTALGILSLRGGSRRWPRFALQSLHRNLSLLSCALLLAHACAPALDWYVNHYAPITWLDAVVPFLSRYQRLDLGLGTLALDLLAVVVLTSLARLRFGYRAWFGVHLLTYLAWGLGVVHGFLIGTDARTPWALAVTAASVGAVAVAVPLRLLGTRRRAEPPAVEVQPAHGRRVAV